MVVVAGQDDREVKLFASFLVLGTVQMFKRKYHITTLFFFQELFVLAKCFPGTVDPSAVEGPAGCLEMGIQFLIVR
jgi:hypothetical protein